MSLYFAYGSNLDDGQMRRRCPGAWRVGRAVLPGYRLAFAGHSQTWGGPVATLVRDREAQVVGIVYRLARGELRVLDRYEGFPYQYQRYRRVARVGKGSRRQLVHVYVLPDDAVCAVPSVPYLTHLWYAYQRLGFDDGPLRAAVVGGAVC